jgi:ATP-dependent DNA helicase PIF1
MGGSRITLSQQQQSVYDDAVYNGANIFITGCGGTGKSVLVKHIVQGLTDKYGGEKDRVAVTASTGRAAFNISGCTLHSFAGIGLGAEDVDVLKRRVSFNSSASARWKRTKVLIVDEVSMISATLFDKVEEIARHLASSTLPFGGIQLILVGDLLQLPPVGNRSSVPRAFQAVSWSSCRLTYVMLKTIYRQKDTEFAKTLACIRVGHTGSPVKEVMAKVCRPVHYPEGLLPVNLYATRARADEYNSRELDKLATELHTFTAIDKGRNKNPLENCPAPSKVALKVGAQVMLIRNLTKELVNGSLGEVIGFADQQNSRSGANQGTGITVLVRFKLSTGRMYTRPIHAEKWETMMPNGNVQCSRHQVPLILAWAMTIHKAQGHTIDRLRVDLEGVFESGQTYTALSRAVGVDTLEVVNYSPSTVKVDVDSVNFCIRNKLV